MRPHSLLAALIAILFALPLAFAQTPAPAPTPAEQAWAGLLKAAKAPNSPEAIALADSIVASAEITRAESMIVFVVKRAQGGEPAVQTAFRAIAVEGKTGTGVLMATANVKLWDNDFDGWTPELIGIKPALACSMAMRAAASPDFKAQVWEYVRKRSAHEPVSRSFFKSYRSKLPRNVQLEVTRTQKDFVLAIPARDAAANSWLAEVSADLVAMQLDQ